METTGTLPPNGQANTQQLVTEIATEAAIKNGLNVDHFVNTISCEIKKDANGYWDYTAQSDIVKDGVRENSWGGWQINLTAHPDITKSEAQDIIWATNWAAMEFGNGHSYQWSCWRKLYG